MGDQLLDLGPLTRSNLFGLGQLLNRGGTGQLVVVHLVVLDAHGLQRGFSVYRIAPLSVAALALHQLVARDDFSGQQASLDLGAYRPDPAFDHVSVRHYARQITLVSRLGHHVVKVGQRLLTDGWAVGLGPAPLATLVGGHQWRIRLACVLGRELYVHGKVHQLVHGQRPLRHGTQTGLHDSQTHGLKIVGHLVLIVGRCCVHHELRVVVCFDQLEAELRVNNDQLVQRQDHGVCGAHGAGFGCHPCNGQPLLHQQGAAGGLHNVTHSVNVELDVLGLLGLKD